MTVSLNARLDEQVTPVVAAAGLLLTIIFLLVFYRVLGMVASYQVGPIMYDYLKTKKGVKSIAFLARNESDAKNQQDEGVEAAKKLGLNVVAASDSYEPGTKDFMPVTQHGLAPLAMVVPPSLGIKSVKEFVAWAKERKGKVNFAI